MTNSGGSLLRNQLIGKVSIALIDLAILSVSLFSSYLIRFDFVIPDVYWEQIKFIAAPFVVMRFCILYTLGVYSKIWKFFSLGDFVSLYKSMAIGSLLFAFLAFVQSNSFSLLVTLFLLMNFFRMRLNIVVPDRNRFVLTFLFIVSILSVGFAFLIFTVMSSSPFLLSEIPVVGGFLSIENLTAYKVPRAILLLEFMLGSVLLSTVRVIPRLVSRQRVSSIANKRRILIYGAGNTGEHLLRYLQTVGYSSYNPIGFIDDEKTIYRKHIHGVPVLGGEACLRKYIDNENVDEILVAIPSLPEERLRSIASTCEGENVVLRIVPDMHSILRGANNVMDLQTIDIAKLLGRGEVDLDDVRVSEYIADKVVLVTGAGGSIGSELCRQIVSLRPENLILLGRGEGSIHQIYSELRLSAENVPCVCAIADVRDENRINAVMNKYSPHVVFHAAAHKHVPFMESDPEEAVINNVFGTKNMCEMAEKYGVGHFVLISTDKAVALSSVMGATKRLAELMLQNISSPSSTRFVTVRFGNVLGSRGSVVPLFEKQIRRGGPVTVTHPKMERYFMSIPEAVKLVLHSGALGENGELCVLDMGEPVPIVKLAENMIRMFGKRPYEDIDIVFTGMRSGEVLSEKLFSGEEDKVTKEVGKITVCQPKREIVSEKYWDELYVAAKNQRTNDLISLISKQLPEFYRPKSDSMSG